MAIVNLPAPAGSQNAGMMQMQAWAQFGRAIGAMMGQRKQNKLQGQDIAGIMAAQQDSRDLLNYSPQTLQQAQAPLAPGQQGPVLPSGQMPQMQSRAGQGMQLQGLMGSMMPPNAVHSGLAARNCMN